MDKFKKLVRVADSISKSSLRGIKDSGALNELYKRVHKVCLDNNFANPMITENRDGSRAIDVMGSSKVPASKMLSVFESNGISGGYIPEGSEGPANIVTFEDPGKGIVNDSFHKVSDSILEGSYEGSDYVDFRIYYGPTSKVYKDASAQLGDTVPELKENYPCSSKYAVFVQGDMNDAPMNEIYGYDSLAEAKSAASSMYEEWSGIPLYSGISEDTPEINTIDEDIMYTVNYVISDLAKHNDVELTPDFVSAKIVNIKCGGDCSNDLLSQIKQAMKLCKFKFRKKFVVEGVTALQFELL